MASTTFVDGETLIEAAWLNDVNAVVYTPGTSTAADIANVPAGNIAATDVQTALNELDTEKIATSAIGVSVQAYAAVLASLAGTLTAANKIPYATALNTAGELTLSTSTSLGTSDTTLSSQKAVKTYVDTQVATAVADSDFTGTNQSLAVGGYQKFPGGLIIQWGTAQETGGANVLQTISLPVNYTTAHLAAYASSGSTGTYAGATTNGGSLSNLQAFASNNLGSYNWFSIGY